MKRKKAAAVLCALAVVFTSSGGLPFGGLRLFDTAIIVSAATDPTYTITIPAEVDLASTDPVNITAEDVALNEGQKIIVTLDGASNTDSGSEFSAKTENGKSEVKYKINDGAIGLDDSNKTVAEFTGNGDKELKFAVTDESGIKYAGTHTETLTFGIAVEDAVTTPTVGTVFPIGTADLGDYYYWNHEIDADRLSKKFRNFGNATISISSNYSHPTLGNYRVIRIVSSTAQYIDWEATQMDPSGPWATWQNSRSINYFKVDNYDTTPTGIKIASGSGTEDDPFTFELVFD